MNPAETALAPKQPGQHLGMPRFAFLDQTKAAEAAQQAFSGFPDLPDVNAAAA
ncbi:MAG: hypothetical protein IIA02_02285 [Proteobacteria bacterium]|nr:hypothetical protein [Pseudomonadota bacterium]